MKKNELIKEIFIAIILIISTYLLISIFSVDYDGSCHNLGYEKYISNLDSCIDLTGKLHFVYHDYKEDFKTFFIPFYSPKLMEIEK